MASSYEIVPPKSQNTQASLEATVDKTTGIPKVHDTMRHGLRSVAAELADRHPLEPRLEQWEGQQEKTKSTLQRDLYGLHAPLRTALDRQCVSYDPHFPAFGQGTSNIHLDILKGTDNTIDVHDVLRDSDVDRNTELSVHDTMERKFGLAK